MSYHLEKIWHGERHGSAWAGGMVFVDIWSIAVYFCHIVTVLISQQIDCYWIKSFKKWKNWENMGICCVKQQLTEEDIKFLKKHTRYDEETIRKKWLNKFKYMILLRFISISAVYQNVRLAQL